MIGNNQDNQDNQDDDEITIKSAFGLWKERNITEKTLRKKTWKQIKQ
jgi:hypothetical protein